MGVSLAWDSDPMEVHFVLSLLKKPNPSTSNILAEPVTLPTPGNAELGEELFP